MKGDVHAILNRRWSSLIDALGVSSAGADETFHELIEAYSGPGRYYHNLDHLASILTTIELLEDESRHRPLVQLAGWFHDAIYDTHAPDNEEKSALLAEGVCNSWGLPPDKTALVGRLIRATRTHQTDEADGFVLLDADLSILGAATDEYDAYTLAIRQEYAWVPEVEFRSGRTRILQGFLERERIFRLERMRQQFEEQARRNLEREIELLARD